MAKTYFLKSGALAALAAGLALAALPSAAFAQDRGHGRWNSGEAQAGSRGSWQQSREDSARAQQQQPTPQAAPRQAAPAPQAMPQRNWANRGGDAPRWGSQQTGSGERHGRNWQRGGEVTRSAPAVNGATPRVPERGVGQRRAESWSGNRAVNRDSGNSAWSGRNRSHVDPDRNRSYRDNRRDGNRTDYRDNHRSWNHDWRRDNRYNWYSYRDSHRYAYRPGRYYAPYRNYYYRPLGIGFYLDSLFFSSRYWIDDPYEYRLPPAYGPYRWVRYYDDVLLVDIYTGEVVDVIHDFFW